MPERSYERYLVKDAIKNDLVPKNFGLDVPLENTTDHYKNFYVKHKEKFEVQ